MTILNYIEIGGSLIFQLLLIWILTRDEPSVIVSFLFGITIYYLAGLAGIFLPESIYAIYKREGLEAFIGLGIFILILFFISRTDFEQKNDITEWGVYFALTNVMFIFNKVPYLVFIPVVATILYSLLEYKAVKKVADTDKL